MIVSWKNNAGFPAFEGLLPRRREPLWVRPAYRRRALRLRRLLFWLFLAVSLTAVVIIAHSTALRINGAVVLARREIPGVPVLFCQSDAAWADDLLGASNRTLGAAGDGVTCLAALMQTQQLPAPFDGPVNPGTLNAWLSANGAYDGRGNLDWSKAAKLLGVELTRRQPGWGVARTLEWLLQREIYPVVRVKRRDTGAIHDVLIVGAVHGEFLIMDPLDPTGIPNALSFYDNRIYSVKYLK